MRSPDLLVIANEEEAWEIVRSFNKNASPQGRWPTITLGSISEEELAYLGIQLGVCDGEEREAVADELLFGEPPGTYVCCVIPEFIDALTRLNADDIRRVAEQWRDTNFQPCGGPRRFAILARMVELARQARASGKSVVRVCPGCEEQG